MKLLLDENLPHQMRLELQGHEVVTAAYMGWGGIENGELLRLAAGNGFDALITNDRGLEYQQNPNTLPLAVIVILTKANTIEAIRPGYAAIIEALNKLEPRKIVKISIA